MSGFSYPDMIMEIEERMKVSISYFNYLLLASPYSKSTNWDIIPTTNTTVEVGTLISIDQAPYHITHQK